MRLEYSWPIRWNTRSAPVRSTRTAMPGNFASKDLAIFSASGRSTEVYQMTLPSFLAASISCGVIALAGGAADMTRVEKALAATSALEPARTSRREKFEPFIASSLGVFFLFSQRAAALGRQMQPDRAALRNAVAGRRHHAQLCAVPGLNHVISAVAEKDLPRDRRRHHVVGLRRLAGRNAYVVRANRHRSGLARRHRLAHAPPRKARQKQAAPPRR